MDAPSDLLSSLPDYASAIGQIESSNNYGSLGPVTKNGDRAYGRYQVMGSNIPAWTAKHYGQSLTPSQFLNNPAAQDAVFNGEFGSSLQKYGNPNDAASMWFSGRPLATAGNSNDGYNTVPQYVNKFNKALGNQALSYAGSNNTPSGVAAITRAMQGNQVANSNPILAALGVDDNRPLGSGLLNGAFNQNQWNVADGLSGLGAGLMMAGGNPFGGASVLNAVNAGRTLNMPKFAQTGQNWLTGQPQYGWIRPSDMAVFGMDGRRIGGGAPSGSNVSNGGAPITNSSPGGDPSQLLGNLETLRKGGATSDQMLSLLPPEIRSYTYGMLNGQDIPQELSRNSALRNSVQLIAHTIDPNLNDSTIKLRQEAAKSQGSLAPNSFGGQLSTADSLLSQLGQYAQLTQKLGNYNYGGPGSTMANQFHQSYMASNDQDYQKLLGQVGTLREGLAGEISKLLTKGVGSETTKQEWRNNLDPTQTPSRMQGQIGSVLDMLRDVTSADVNQHNTAFGSSKNLEDFLTPQSQGVIQGIKSGSIYGQPNAQAGATAAPRIAVNPKTGQRLMLKGGQWQPI